MASTYGVSYGGRKNPVNFGTVDSRSSLGSLMSPTQRARPISAAGFKPISASTVDPSDAFSRAIAKGQDSFSALVPKTTAPAAAKVAPISSSPSGFSDTGDPILQQIKAIGLRGAQDAASGSLAGAKNDLINYGSTQVPQTLRDLFAAQTPQNDPILGDLPGNPVLAALNDAQTGQAAGANPYSTLAGLKGAHESNVHGIDQAANANNLYYSSTHANSLGDENQNYLGAQNTAAQNLAALLSGENNGLLGALGSAHDQYNAALPGAFDRWTAAGGTSDGTTTTPPPAGDGTTPPPTDTAGYKGITAAQPTLAQLLLASLGRTAAGHTTGSVFT